MKIKIIAAGFVMFSVMLPLEAQAVNIKKMFVFGDSSADTGNVFYLTNGGLNPATATPASPPYFLGRFSNGPLWVDYLGQKLGLQPTLVTHVLYNNAVPTQGINFAIGGANSGLGNAIVPNAPLPGVLEQVQGFLQSSAGMADPNALYAVVGGANDYLFAKGPSDPNQPKPYKNISQAVNSLAAAGAKNIVVLNLPDLGKVPAANLGGLNPADLTTATQEFNSNLAKDLAKIRQQNGNINIQQVNVYSLVNRWLASPSQFGFTNVTHPCLQVTTATICSNPDEYLFWDGFHPTTKAHKMIADAISVPEPSTMMGTLASAAVGTLGILKRQRQKSSLTAVGK